jgi:GH43 family beta-xylosidase
MRDPCILRGPDGTFHMVWTVGWRDGSTLGYASSKDLINWSPQRGIKVMENEPASRNVWAPELFYDEAKEQFMIFWSSTVPGKFPETEKTGDDGYDHRVYYVTTKDFEKFSPTKLLFDGGFNVIDATIIKDAGKHYLIVKDETRNPVKKNLRWAVSDNAEGPYTQVSEPFTMSWVEGPSVIKINGEFHVYFDHYARPQYYGAVKSRDLKTWEDVSKQMSFPAGMRHGTIIEVSEQVLDGLLKQGQ